LLDSHGNYYAIVKLNSKTIDNIFVLLNIFDIIPLDLSLTVKIEVIYLTLKENLRSKNRRISDDRSQRTEICTTAINYGTKVTSSKLLVKFMDHRQLLSGMTILTTRKSVIPACCRPESRESKMLM